MQADGGRGVSSNEREMSVGFLKLYFCVMVPGRWVTSSSTQTASSENAKQCQGQSQPTEI